MSHEYREMRHTNEDALISQVWSFETPEGFSEPNDRKDYSPSEPTPIVNQCNPHYDEVAAHQSIVKQSFDPLFGELAPGTIPEKVKEMIELDRMVGDARRSSENLMSYGTWSGSDVMKHELDTSDLHAVHNELLLGTVRPLGSISLVHHTSLPSAEVKKITHPYGYRMNFVAPARQETEEAITAFGGVVLPRVLSSYEKIQLQPNFTQLDKRGKLVQLNGFLTTYKRLVGYVTRQDGRRTNVIERQSAALRIDEAVKDLPPELAEALRQVLDTGGNYELRLDALDQQTGYNEFFETAIQQDADVDYLVPLSTTIYAATEYDVDYQKRLREAAFQNARSSRVSKALSDSARSGMLFVDNR